MKNSGYHKYKKTSVESASREKLLLLMYEGAIKFTKRAVIACNSGNIADRGENIGRAYDIILELNNTLNHELGGDVAKNLEQLYMFIIDQYTKANLSGEIKPLEESLQILETLHKGWVEAVEKLKKADSGLNENGNMGSRTA